jgi:predicted nucleic acid-binding protein
VSQRGTFYVEEYFLSRSLRLADALIAATAAEHGLPLATANERHYRAVPELVLEHFRP